MAATLLGLMGALALLAAGQRAWADRLDFSAIVLRGLLPFLLFAGALHIDPPSLRQEAGFIALLSTAGVAVATFFVGCALHWMLGLLGGGASLPVCLLFGALISPTDPVAVLAIFRRARAPRTLAITVGAESLFNDGFAVVMFASLLGAVEGSAISPWRACLLFFRQAGGGLLAGLLLGQAAARAIDALEGLPAQIAATAALAFGGYAAANALGLSGLLATVVAGIHAGGRDIRLKAFWTRVDAALNVLVFALLGLSAAKIPWTERAVPLGLLAVALVLAGRAVSVALSMAALRPWRAFAPGTFRALTWGGLRGAIPLALALSLPNGPDRALVLALTYVVGLFSLIVQGSTL